MRSVSSFLRIPGTIATERRFRERRSVTCSAGPHRPRPFGQRRKRTGTPLSGLWNTVNKIGTCNPGVVRVALAAGRRKRRKRHRSSGIGGYSYGAHSLARNAVAVGQSGQKQGPGRRKGEFEKERGL
eukprot:TRINITY_DN21151_c0_g1_i1.p4 TRINITY_DN21151_c0_g1~~TRINITY_DN21151_c0_g1_i1.p4  ORF type:complete len:127 (-),score=5.04 TRINITY_DN21151_c0_g1_i1:119-499(-)